MKKIIALLMATIMLLSFTACGKSKKQNENFVDLEYYAKLGQMPEAEYSLGDDVDTVINELTKKRDDIMNSEQPDTDDSHNHDEQQFYFEVTEGEKSVLLDNGTISYYYKKAKKQEGVSCIVSNDKAFGFENGTVIIEVKEALEGFELTEEALNDENGFFAFGISDGIVLTAEFKGVVISFVFQENELRAAAMYNQNW